MQDVPQAALRVSQEIAELRNDAGVQTGGFPLRELEAFDKGLQTTTGALAIARAKKVTLQQDIAKRREKIADAPNAEARLFQEAKLKELLDLEAPHDEAIRELQSRLKNQVLQIKESITRFLTEDTPLGERIRTLFREQGVTIASILTALGMVISTIALAITGGGSGAAAAAPPTEPGGAKAWIKAQLQKLADLLKSLAEKAAAALPGIIGSIVSWILEKGGEAVRWVGEHVWTLVVAGVVAVVAYMKPKST
jgi:hypothetical protein